MPELWCLIMAGCRRSVAFPAICREPAVNQTALFHRVHSIGQFAAATRQVAGQASFLPNLHAPDIQRLAQIIVGVRLPAKAYVHSIEMRRVYQRFRGQAPSYAFGRSRAG